MPNDKIIKVEIEDYMVYDRLNDIAKELATTTDKLVNHAIRRLVHDVEFIWTLRRGTFKVPR